MCDCETTEKQLAGENREMGWPAIPTGCPTEVRNKILAHRKNALVAYEKSCRDGVCIVTAKRKCERRQDGPVDDAEPNENGCTCECTSCVGDDCLGCTNEFCDDPECQNVRDRAEMSAHLDAVKNWISPTAQSVS